MKKIKSFINKKNLYLLIMNKKEKTKDTMATSPTFLILKKKFNII